MSTEEKPLTAVPEFASDKTEFQVMGDADSMLSKVDPKLMGTLRTATSAAWASGGVESLRIAVSLLEFEDGLKPEEVSRFRAAIGAKHEIQERKTRKPKAKKTK